jgi:hypothetical protein
MTNLWQKLALKENDFVFEVPVGSRFWGKEMHEPLLIIVCLPFTKHSPWKLGGSPRLLELARQLRRLWEEPDGDPGFILRKLLKLSGRLSTMPAKLVQQMLHTSGR